MTPALNIARSILGQPWRWRGTGADGRDPDFRPDDLVTQLLLARGCTREDMAEHSEHTIRAFMPDPTLFPDMRPEERRRGDECVSRCRCRWSAYNSQKKRKRKKQT